MKSLPKHYDSRKTGRKNYSMLSGMREPWLMRTWAGTNVHAANLKGPARYRRFYAEAPDYEDVAERLGLN